MEGTPINLEKSPLLVGPVDTPQFISYYYVNYIKDFKYRYGNQILIYIRHNLRYLSCIIYAYHHVLLPMLAANPAA